jgi:hypothetical protein
MQQIATNSILLVLDLQLRDEVAEVELLCDLLPVGRTKSARSFGLDVVLQDLAKGLALDLRGLDLLEGGLREVLVDGSADLLRTRPPFQLCPSTLSSLSLL